jgi:hypothetical protein
MVLIRGPDTWAQEKDQPKSLRWNDVAQRWDLRTNDGQFAGYVRKNFLFEDRYDQYDRKGHFVGNWHRNEIVDRWEFRER